METFVLTGKTIVEGYAEGRALVTSQPLSFMGSIDSKTGQIIEQGHELEGEYMTGKIFAFPFSKGSTGGSYMLYDVVKNKKGPIGIINTDAESVCVIGAIVAELPMVNKIDVTQIKNGDLIKLYATKGFVEITRDGGF